MLSKSGPGQSVLIEARHLVKEYPAPAGRVRVVDNVSLHIHRGETLGLVGESGSGKSTVARMLLRLIEPSSGAVLYNGTNLLTLPPRQMRAIRRRIQIVFQDPYAALNPRMRVRQILAEPFAIHGLPGAEGLSRSARAAHLHARLSEMLAEVGLDESALSRFPHEFSGGQRQRINVARALALHPELLVLDEPVSALDVSVGAQVINLLRDLQRTHRLTYLFISHSMPLVRYLCDTVAVMRNGRIEEYGDVLDLCERPQKEYTRRLVEATPELPLPANSF